MGFMDSIADPYRKVMGKPKPQPDPLAFLLQPPGIPSSRDLYADAVSQVGGAYQGQLENLDGQARDARNRAKSGDKNLGAMYDQLAREIGKNQGGIDRMYGDARKSTSQNTARTKGAISDTYRQTNNELGALFSRLGIEAAAPDALAGSNSDRNFLSSLVDFSGSSANNALTQNHAAASDFNKAQQNMAGMAGRNRRADLMTQLNETLSGIGQQRNSVYGQMSDAINQRQYQLEQDALSRQNQMQDMMFQMQKMQMEQAAAGQQGGPSFAQQWSTMGDQDKTAFKADQLVGQEAPFAMELLTGVATNQNSGVYPNMAHFIRSVMAENEKQKAAGRGYIDPQALQSLAAYYWSEGGVSQKPMQADYLQRLN